MEEQCSSVPANLFLAALAAWMIYWYGTCTFNTFKKLGIPVRHRPLPYFGNFFKDLSQSIPDVDRAAPQTIGRISGTYVGKEPVLVISEAELIKQITIKEFHKFTNRRPFLSDVESILFNRSLVMLIDDHWKHLRTVLTPTFTSGKLKNMFPAIKSCADKLAEHISRSKTQAILIKEYASGYALDVVAKTAFGLDLGTQEQIDHPFVKHAGTFVGVARKPSIWSPTKLLIDVLVLVLFPRPMKKLYGKTVGYSFADGESEEYLQETIKRVLQERASSANEMATNDFLNMIASQVVDMEKAKPDLLRVTDGKRWTTEGITEGEMISSAITFLTAGYDTTATALQFFFYNMALYPEVQNQLYEEVHAMEMEESSEGMTYDQINKLEYLECCIQESLRLYPSVTRFDRVASEDMEIDGLKIAKGMGVIIPTFSVHYDPEYWPDPYSFSPERFLSENRSSLYQYTWLPFGAGGRICIGQRLALLEMKLAIYQLLKQYKITKTLETILPENLEFKKAQLFVQLEKPILVGIEKR